jgi:hypothetical protein
MWEDLSSAFSPTISPDLLMPSRQQSQREQLELGSKASLASFNLLHQETLLDFPNTSQAALDSESHTWLGTFLESRDYP